MPSPRFLLTGFTPFGGDKINPSWLAVRQVAEARPDEVRAVEIPTVFATAINDLEAAIEEHRPEQVPDGNGPSLSIDQIAQGVSIMVDACLAENAQLLETQPPRVPSAP